MRTSEHTRCAVCTQETTKRCGKCRAIFFCSTRCQALLWPTHKVLCGRDLHVFYLPPLTPAELKVDEIKDKHPYRDRLLSLHEWVTKVHGETWAAFRSTLTTPASQNLLLEEMRMSNVLVAYAYLCQEGVAEITAGSTDRASTPWHQFANMACFIRDRYYAKLLESSKSREQEARDPVAGRGSFVVNAFWRQELVLGTLGAQASGAAARLSEEEFLQFAEKLQLGAIEVLKRADILESTKKHLKEKCPESALRANITRHYLGGS
ncbi:hypothetical protein JCM3770_000080 [Rhodotorula araucariae]